MEVVNFVITIVIVTASGALAPGPLFFANISHGTKHGAKSGLIFSIAHTFVEFTLVMLLALGILTAINNSTVKGAIGITGGVVLTIFGLYQVYTSIKFKFEDQKKSKLKFSSLFFIGLTFTGMNPFFIIWWLTAGAQLIIISLEFASLIGVVFMYICHVWMDYTWLITTAHLAKLGMNMITYKIYRLIIAVLGIILVYFGISFILAF